jgi:molybdopterin-guanine dinucleotide biosynthesis protein B
MMSIAHIIGQPGSGKTTLVAALVNHFTKKGFAVGTLKHSSHGHELDKPGKDSHVHRIAGANPAGMVTSRMAALYFPISDQTRPDDLIQRYYTHADIVLIEGWISGPYPKIEVRRHTLGKPPLFPDLPTVRALVCDCNPDVAANYKLDFFALDRVEDITDYIQVLK